MHEVVREEIEAARARGMVYHVIVLGLSFGEILYAGKWLVEEYACENGKDYRYIHDMDSEERHWLFRDHGTAMAFKLRWG